MLRKQWQDYALKAKQIAKHIVTGLEQDKNGVRLVQIVYGLDMYATDALNLKYSKQRSKSSVHTYQGGIQEISTQHADGSEGLFKSNGECQSTNNPMDIEVKEYMNNSKNESKNMNKKLIRLTENDLHRIVKESVNRVLRESQFMNDENIASQYKNMRITYFDIKPLINSDGWKGTFELEFPNADDVDFDGTMVNDFIVYDMVGNQIAWDNWMPDEQTKRLEKIIRQEIVKRTR